MAEKNYIGVVALTLPRAKKELALLRKASDTLSDLLEKEAKAALQPIVLRSVIRDLTGQKPEEDGILGLGRLLNQPPEDKRYAELKFHLPPLVWSSLFLSGYSVLEHYMVSTCDQFDTLFDWRAKPKHLRGLGVGRCKTYLTVIAGLDLPADWAKLTEYNKVRNCLVHSAGRVEYSSDRKWLQQHVNDSAHLSTDGLGYLQMYRDYLTEFFDTVESFSNDLAASVESRIKWLLVNQKTHNPPLQADEGRERS